MYKIIIIIEGDTHIYDTQVHYLKVFLLNSRFLMCSCAQGLGRWLFYEQDLVIENDLLVKVCKLSWETWGLTQLLCGGFMRPFNTLNSTVQDQYYNLGFSRECSRNLHIFWIIQSVQLHIIDKVWLITYDLHFMWLLICVKTYKHLSLSTLTLFTWFSTDFKVGRKHLTHLNSTIKNPDEKISIKSLC